MTAPPPLPNSPQRPPTWVSGLLACIPVVPPLYILAVGCLSHLRRLPLTARAVLFFFAATQLLAALFTPAPVLSLALAAARTLLILAMIAAGVYLGQSKYLRPLLWGHIVIFISAWGYTLHTQGWNGIQERLGHPYYYVVSLGLVAVVALWLVLFWSGGARWWRWTAGLLAASTFVASGSRGPLLALGAGSFATLAFGGGRRRWWVMLPAALVVFLAATGSSLNFPFKPLERLLNDQSSGREYVWQDAVKGWETSPLGGVGPYQGGPYLTYLFKDGCQLTPTLARNKIECPETLSRWSSVWLIAHNAWLHWMLESGLIGLSGLILLMAYALWRAIQQGDPLVLAILFGFTAMNVVDVVIAVPSPHFAELWWVCVGMALVNIRVGRALTSQTGPVPTRPVHTA